MKRIIVIICALLASASFAFAGGGKDFKTYTVLYEGEHSLDAGIMSGRFNSSDSEILLLVTGLDASGKVFRFSPSYSFAYSNNASLGFRFNFSKIDASINHLTAGLFSEDLSLSVSGQDLSVCSYGAQVFHRNYFGLDEKGTLGLFCEFRMGLDYNRVQLAQNAFTDNYKVSLTFAPGVILYVLPFVSLEASVGMGGLSYSNSNPFVDEQRRGFSNRFKAGLGLDILNCSFGVSYHF